MNYTEYTSLVQHGIDFGIDPSLRISDFRGHCAVDGFVARKLKATSPKYKRGSEIDILLGKGRGTVYLLTSRDCTFTYGQASSIWASAFLAETDANLFANQLTGVIRDFQFQNDYILTHQTVWDIYERLYRVGSVAWGNFSHIEDASPLPIYSTNTSPIEAKKSIKLPTAEHADAAIRALTQNSALTRYLNLYHLLELSFDYDLVMDIRSLGDNLKGIGKLLNSYSNKELDRLCRLMAKHINNEEEIAAALRPIFNNTPYQSKISEMLFDYPKDGHPFADKRSELFSAARLGFDRPSFKTAKIEWSLEKLNKLAAYIIYRFRCSIAHSTIGEFIISGADEKFVAEIAEPLAMKVISQIYKQTKS